MGSPDVDSGSPLGLGRTSLLVSGLVLVALTAWAFSGTTDPASTTTGVRVSPASAYNPVTAGERLPDGFRQLLPRDAIQPIYDPTFVKASDIAWPDDTDVIGVTQGNQSKAYPVSFLNGHELVIDEIDNIPILVSW